MRIAQVVPYRLHPYSGILQAIVELTVALARCGADVEIWRLEAWPDDAQDLAETLDAANIERVLVPMSKNYWRLSGAAKKFFAEQTVDIVHLHGAFSPMNNLIARELKVPYVLSPHGGYAGAVVDRHPLRKMLFKHLFELRMIRDAAALWALTEAEKDEIARFCSHSHVEVGPSGYDPRFRDADPMTFRRELGIEAGTPLAIFVGRLDLYYKGLDNLVVSLSGVPGWHLALIGPDWQHGRRQLEHLIRRHGLGGWVHLVRPRRGRALHEAFAAADLFVLMSRSEGLPIALLAALSHGVPALVSPAVERALGVAAAGAGWVCQPDDLATTLNELSRLNARKWKAFRAAAVSKSERYGWGNPIECYLKVITCKSPFENGFNG